MIQWKILDTGLQGKKNIACLGIKALYNWNIHTRK